MYTMKCTNKNDEIHITILKNKNCKNDNNNWNKTKQKTYVFVHEIKKPIKITKTKIIFVQHQK